MTFKFVGRLLLIELTVALILVGVLIFAFG